MGSCFAWTAQRLSYIALVDVFTLSHKLGITAAALDYIVKHSLETQDLPPSKRRNLLTTGQVQLPTNGKGAPKAAKAKNRSFLEVLDSHDVDWIVFVLYDGEEQHFASAYVDVAANAVVANPLRSCGARGLVSTSASF